MRNFQDTFETHKRSFISAFSICMTITLKTRAMLQAANSKTLLNSINEKGLSKNRCQGE